MHVSRQIDRHRLIVQHIKATEFEHKIYDLWLKIESCILREFVICVECDSCDVIDVH